MSIIKELQEDLKKDITETPKTSGKVSTPPPPVELETKLTDLENKQNILERSVDSVRHTNTFVLVVLLLGFITMFMAFITMLILAFNSGAATQIEFIRSLQKIIDALPQK
jgi:hypothetical protein